MNVWKKTGSILIVVFLLLSLVLTGCGNTNTAQKDADAGNTVDYPTKPIDMVLAFTAGGSSDVQARIMQKYWNQYVDQPWVFKYVTGAGGAVGFAQVAHSKPDGYTIGGVNVPHMILEPMMEGAQFTIDDYEYICQVVNDPQVIAVRKDSPFKSWDEIVAYDKANPGKLKVGTVGKWTGSGVMLLDIQDKTGIKPTQVVYNGTADQNAALLGGEIDFMVGFLNDVMRALDQMTVFGVSSEERSSLLPDVPTLKEIGLDVLADTRRGFVVPKGTDPQMVQFLRDAFQKIQDNPDYIADMKKAGQPTGYLTGPEFQKYINSQQAHYKQLLEKFGVLK